MAQTGSIPSLLTPGRLADEVGAPLHRVLYVLHTRLHIQPVARAGTLRLFDRAAIAKIHHELHAIDARRCRKGVSNG